MYIFSVPIFPIIFLSVLLLLDCSLALFFLLSHVLYFRVPSNSFLLKRSLVSLESEPDYDATTVVDETELRN